METERSFAAEPASVRDARAFAADALAGTEVDVQLVRVLTSELATNAVLHAKSAFRVRVHAERERARVEVVNTEPELLVAMRDPSQGGGRGLGLVKRLSLQWGTESSRDEKIVWFEVPARRPEAE